MFKKVKSLLVAGLLVMGMSGSVFAANESTCVVPATGTHGTGENAHVHTIEYEEAINNDEVTNLKDEINKNSKYYIAEEGSEVINDKGNTVRTIDVYFDANCDGDRNDGELGDRLIETIKIEVNGNVGAAVEKGWEDILTPETGDAIALGGLAVAGVAVGALALNNKKKNRK